MINSFFLCHLTKYSIIFLYNEWGWKWMSKKNKEKIVISNEELKPTVLYTIKERKTNFIGLILLFAIFIGVVYFLPTLSEKYEEYKKKNNPDMTISPSNPTQKPNEGEDEDDVGVEDTRFDFASNPNIQNDDILVNNFSYTNNVLTFDVSNIKDTPVSLQSKKYYLELFDSTDTLIKRILVGEGTYKASEKKNMTFALTAQNISSLYLKQIMPDDYPEFILPPNENGSSILSCRLNETNYIYTFTNNVLTQINEVVTLDQNNANYSTLLSANQSKMQSLNSANGVTVATSTNEASTIFNYVIDPALAAIDSLENNNYYAKTATAKTINFEVEARGYNCN